MTKKMTIKEQISNLLSELEDMTSIEISEVLGISLKTIRQTLWRDSIDKYPLFTKYKNYYTLSNKLYERNTIKLQKIILISKDKELASCYNIIAKQDKKIEELKKKIKD